MRKSITAIALFVSFVVLGCVAPASAGIVNLADIIGGGNGFGTGTVNTGIDPRTGLIVGPITSTDNLGVSDVYSPVPSNAFIDGVFVPGAGAGSETVSSTGLIASLPVTGGASWENGMGYNGACCGSTILVSSVSTNFFAGGLSGIGFHANKGVTFDMDAIRATLPNTINSYSKLTGFSAYVGSTAAAAPCSTYCSMA